MIRLTLRSLLAYLDEVSDLTDEQRAELHTQIEASDFAKELVHRLKDAANRTRLPAPELLGLGPADDPNTVAEYLENQLPPESVAEFERVCLESDTMLAEVAACHHILKELLERPEAIDPADRVRIESTVLRTLAGGDAAADERLRIENSHANGAAPGAAVGADDQEALREAAERIKEDELSSRILIGVGAVAALVLGMLAYQMLGPRDIALVTPADDAEQATSEADEANEASAADEADEPSPADTAAGDEPAPAVEPTPEAEPTASSDSAETPADAAAPAPPIDSEPSDAEVTIDAGDDANDSAAAGTVVPGASPLPAEEPMTDPQEGVASDTAVEPADESEAEPADAAAPIADEPPADEVEPVAVIALFEGPATSVAALDDGEGQWLRCVVGAELPPDVRVASFPAFRSRLSLAEGVELELVGDTVVTLTTSEADPARPRVVVEHGRLTLRVAKEATAAAAIDVDVSGTVAEVEVDPGASVSIEVQRPYTPGFNTLAGSPALAVSGWAPSGGVSWASTSATVQAQRPKRWALDEAGGFVSLASYDEDPGWIEPQGQDLTIERAAATLASRLNAAEPILPQFVEAAAGGELPEVAQLAAKCAASLGVPDALVGTLNDPAVYAPVVADNVGHLRQLISRDTASAEAIRRVLVEYHGDQTAIDLYFMLGGFNEEQVGLTPVEQKSGAIAQLLDWLQEAEAPLAVSRLAIVNLDELLAEPASGEIDPVQDSPFARRKEAQKLAKRLQRGTLELRRPAPVGTTP